MGAFDRPLPDGGALVSEINSRWIDNIGSGRRDAPLFPRGCRVITVSSGRFWTIPGMAQTFIGCDRDQSFLMPPDIRDWLAEDHLAWFVLDAVAGMNLGAFYGAYRRDGVGRRAYDPAMVVALLLYCYARGVRSARAIERACREDVACRVIAMLEVPDHATIARFVDRHEVALAELVRAGAWALR